MTHTPIAPKKKDDTTIRLYGGGPDCPECGESTYAVTAADGAERPWWCQDCNLRVSSEATDE